MLTIATWQAFQYSAVSS